MPNTLPPILRSGAWLAFGLTTAFFLYGFVASIVPGLASEQIASWYGLTDGEFSTLASLYFWVYAPLQIAVGLLLDRYGASRMMLPAIAFCALGVGLFALTAHVLPAAFGRALTGLGAAFAYVGALYVVNHRFPPDRFAFLAGIVNSVGMLGTAIGAVALSTTIETAGWRSVFLGIALAGALLFVLSFLFLRDGADSPAPAPAAHPLAALKPLARDGGIWLLALIGALYYMPVNVYAGLWGEAHLVHDRGFTKPQAETAVSMVYWGMAVGCIAGGWLSDHLGHRKALLVVSATATGAAYAAALFLPGLTVETTAAFLFLGGLFGGPQMLVIAIAKEGHPAEVSGTVIAFVNMLGIAGALLFQPLVGLLIDEDGGAYTFAMLTVPATCFLAALTALAIREQRHADHLPAPA